ncbi:hypothetical protein ACFSHQ_20275 [Gemmobacter lanyuensis]
MTSGRSARRPAASRPTGSVRCWIRPPGRVRPLHRPWRRCRPRWAGRGRDRVERGGADGDRGCRYADGSDGASRRADAAGRRCGAAARAACAASARAGDKANVVQYALATNHAVGTPMYERSSLQLRSPEKACASYASPDQAQAAFLDAGGPDKDRKGLDPDGDGFACSWDPTPSAMR